MHRRWTSRLASLALIAATLAVAPNPAAAEHRALELDLRSLSVRADGGDLVVDYRVGGKDWSWANRHDADLAFQFRGLHKHHGHSDWHDAGFDSHSGTLRIPWSGHSQLPRRLQIRLVAASHHSHVRHFHHRGHHHASMRLHRDDEGHFRRHLTSRRGDDLEDLVAPKVVELCDDHTLGANREDRCLETVAFAMSTSETIEALTACGEATNQSDDFLDCVERATMFHADAGPAIRTCSEELTFSSYFADCLHYASRIPHGADRVVRTCKKRAANFDQNTVRCVETASRLSEPAAKVAACGYAESTKGGFKRCLESFKH